MNNFLQKYYYSYRTHLHWVLPLRYFRFWIFFVIQILVSEIIYIHHLCILYFCTYTNFAWQGFFQVAKSFHATSCCISIKLACNYSQKIRTQFENASSGMFFTQWMWNICYCVCSLFRSQQKRKDVQNAQLSLVSVKTKNKETETKKQQQNGEKSF